MFIYASRHAFPMAIQGGVQSVLCKLIHTSMQKRSKNNFAPLIVYILKPMALSLISPIN